MSVVKTKGVQDLYMVLVYKVKYVSERYLEIINSFCQLSTSTSEHFVNFAPENSL